MGDRILITGASGFIGTNLLQAFIDKEYDVINVDIVQPRNLLHLQYWKKIDITDFNSFRKILIQLNPDYIIHLAARTDLEGMDITDYSANTVGVSNLMKIVNELPSLKKVIITSSMLVCKGGYYPKSQFDYLPSTLYGESKVLTENMVWANKPSCDWAILRPTSIWGPWFGSPYRDFFSQVIAKHYFHIGDRGCTKTYGYVENSIYQIEQILFSNTVDEGNKVFYIGDNPPTNIVDWANELAVEIGYKLIKMPFFIIKIAAVFGDFLKKLNIRFPITSFRLKNMTTDNIINLDNTYAIAPNPPCKRVEGVKNTLKWITEISQ